MATCKRRAARWRGMFGRAGILAGLLGFVALLAASSAAGSVLYYQSGASIDRLDLNGHHSPSRVVGSRTVGSGVFAMAVSGPYLYWSEVNGVNRSSIWRARLDGRNARTLIHMPSSGPYGPVIAGGHIYWSETDAIARANLNGSHVQRDFAPLPLQSSGEAADGLATDGHYIYFSRCQDGTIGRVALDGTDANPDFIVLARGQCPQAIVVVEGRIYWTSVGLERRPGMIGRTNLDGSEQTDSWLAMPATPYGGPWSLAAANGYLFFMWGGTPESARTFIGTAALGGSARVAAKLIRVRSGGAAIAIAP